MINEELQEIPTRRETLGEALTGMFMGGSGLGAALQLAVGVASLGWLSDSLLPILQDAGLVVLYKWRGLPAETHFADWSVKLSLPLVWFIILVVILYLRHRSRLTPRQYSSIVPAPHRGLIVMLSKYSCYNDKKAAATEISLAIEAGKLDLDQVMKGCNWGPLAFVVRYHAPMLEKCWIIVTDDSAEDECDGSANEYEHAAKLVQFIARNYHAVECEKVIIADPNDIGQAAQAISRIYRELGESDTGLRPSEVIADFTGGTAAMSGGMVMASLDDGHELEYVTRRETLSEAITPSYIREKSLIISPRTTLRLAHLLARRA
jgi:hypothetical protein